VEFVEVTEAVAAQGGRSAEGAVDLDVLTAIRKVGHWLLLGSFNVSEFQGFKSKIKTLKLSSLETWYPSPSPTVYWNHGFGGILRFNLLVAMS